MKFLYWVGRNLPAVLCLGFAIGAIVQGEHVFALYFLFGVHCFAVQDSLGQIRDRLDAMKDGD